MKVFDAQSLRKERERLELKIQNHEKDFHIGLSSVEQTLGPVTRFFFPKHNGEKDSDTNDWYHKVIRLAIPILVDRLTFGTRGLFINRSMTAILQFLAGKLSAEKLNSFLRNIINSGLDKIKFGKQEEKSNS